MAAVKYISRDKLPQWLAALATDRRVLVPVAEGDGVVFRAYDPARTPIDLFSSFPATRNFAATASAVLQRAGSVPSRTIFHLLSKIQMS